MNLLFVALATFTVFQFAGGSKFQKDRHHIVNRGRMMLEEYEQQHDPPFINQLLDAQVPPEDITRYNGLNSAVPPEDITRNTGLNSAGSLPPEDITRNAGLNSADVQRKDEGGRSSQWHLTRRK